MGLPPNHAIGAGPRFGALGRAFGSSAGGTSKTASANVGSSSTLQAPPARRRLASAGLQTRASIVIAIGVVGSIASATLTTRSTINAVATKNNNKTGSATLTTRSTIGAVATKNNTKTGSATLTTRSTIGATAQRARVSSSTLFTSASIYATATKTAGALKLGSATLLARSILSANVQRSKTISANLNAVSYINAFVIGPAVACECPPWHIDSAPPCGWLIDTVQCSDDQATLPFTLSMFRMYVFSELVTGGAYHRSDDITCTISNVQTLASATTRDGTLVNAFGRRGCQ